MDEFSDFQMAVQLPPPKVVTVGISPPRFNANYVTPQRLPGKNPLSSLRLSSDSSPVHSIANHSNKSDLISQLNTNQVLSPGMAVNKPGGNVGSRLANYDLGLSVPLSQAGTPITQNGAQNPMEHPPLNSSFVSFPKTIIQPSSQYQPQANFQKTHQDLLIGEEDKYSALRMLIETDITSSPPSIFETPIKNGTESSLQPNNSHCTAGDFNSIHENAHSKNTFSPSSDIFSSASPESSFPTKSGNFYNATETFKLPNGTQSSFLEETTAGDYSDFGDFQSCTGFTATPSTSNNTFLDDSPPVFPTVSATAPILQPNPISANSSGILSKLSCEPLTDLLGSKSGRVENGTCDSDDGEFGDFVSVEPVIQTTPPAMVPMSQPNISFWNKNNINVASITPLKQTPPPLPTFNDDKENVEDIMDIGSYFSSYNSPLDSDIIRPDPKPRPLSELPDMNFDNGGVEEDFSSLSNISIDKSLSSLATSNDTTNPLDYSTIGSDMNIFAHASTVSTSSYIRTSLIRNDKVTEIDSSKWNMSVEEGSADCSMLDNSPFDKKEVPSPTVVKSKFLDVSPETRSIASLDLGNYVTVDYSETGNINNNNTSSSVYGSATPPSNLHTNGLDSAPSLAAGNLRKESVPLATADPINYDDFDRYQCFRDECDGEKERFYQEWSRCVAACKDSIAHALAVFNGVSTSEVIKEVVADEKGYLFVINVLEIYRLSQRIQKSAVKVGVETRLENIFFEISTLWETLSAFLLGTCVSTELYQENEDSDNYPYDDYTSSHSPCGVCLCAVKTSDSNECLDYGGKTYHYKCANFWVNAVETILPSLSNRANTVSKSDTTEPSTSSFKNTNIPKFSGRSSSRI